jgi:TRAP-type C4-dicarboxylate transport system permease small subunit
MQLFDRFLRGIALLGGAALMILMFYTVLDVTMRYGFNKPFSGSLEFTEFSMTVIVFLGLAYCGWTGGHVAVDILEQPLKHPSLRWVPAILTLISAVLFAVIAYESAKQGLGNMQRISNMMRWPHFPFLLNVAFGSALFAIVLFIQGIRALRRKD